MAAQDVRTKRLLSLCLRALLVIAAAIALSRGTALAGADDEEQPATPCPDSLPTIGEKPVKDEVLTIRSSPGKTSYAKVSKSMLRGDAKTGDVGDDYTFCTMLAEPAYTGATCDTSNTKKAIRGLAFYKCESVDGKDVLKKLDDDSVAAELGPANETVPVLYLSYTPRKNYKGNKLGALRLEKGDKTVAHAQPIIAVSEAADDNFKIDLYTGVSLLFTSSDFSNAFASVLVAAEPRFADERRGLADIRLGHWYWIGRGYAEGGLTATATCTQTTTDQTPQGQASDTPKCSDQSSISGTKAFAGKIGIGGGWAVPIDTREDFTRAFAVLLVVKVGVASIPKTDTADGFLAFGDFFGVHIENEGGHFDRAYVETGFGQSDQYQAQRTARWKTDVMVPFTEPDHTARLALRFQIDTVSPVAHLNTAHTDAEKKLINAGDIKISLLLNVDIRKLFNLLGPSVQ